MSNSSPIENLASRRVGTVEYVSPDEFKIVLDTEAPDKMALNTGIPRNFPRINGYLLIPTDLGFIVGQISWITIERSNFPIRKGFKDFGLVDIPFPLRKINIHPVGTIRNGSDNLKFERGIEDFPSVGDIVLLPTDDQLKAITEAGEYRRVHIGNSVLVGGSKVMIDPDKLFGRHLAVLGNTGSGKSCSVAGLVRWSIENAYRDNTLKDSEINSRFIILDPNGEYSRAFKDLPGTKIFSVEPKNGEYLLQVPMWLWNTDEWCGFTRATPKTQRPTIIQALKVLRSGNILDTVSDAHAVSVYARTLIIILKTVISEGIPWHSNYGKRRGFYDLLKVWKEGLSIDRNISDDLTDAIDNASSLLDLFIQRWAGQGFQGYQFSLNDTNQLLSLFCDIFYKAGGSDEELMPIDPDCPKPFKGMDFIDAIQASAELLHTSEYLDSTINIVKTLINDPLLKKVVSSTDITLKGWLDTYVGTNNSNSIIILDLSLLPTHVITTLTCVISRLIFEALQRYRKTTDECLPTVLVIEEAHHFIKRYIDDAESLGSDILCCKIFERIAREGRKFGLGMIVSSQRPSELSPTVLSQCNSFLIHRISNDRDQELVGRLLPDNMRGLLRELPSLPSQNAILLGWATELPQLVKMKYLPKFQRPQSTDPDYWDVWTNNKKRGIDWDKLSKEWQM